MSISVADIFLAYLNYAIGRGSSHLADYSRISNTRMGKVIQSRLAEVNYLGKYFTDHISNLKHLYHV